MLATRLHRAGLTLVEVAISILVMAILAGMVLVNAQTNVTDQIGAACQIVAADMARARSLAVTNNDKYRFTFSIDNNWYYLQYTGSNSALNSLPSTPYYTGKDTATQQYPTRRPKSRFTPSAPTAAARRQPRRSSSAPMARRPPPTKHKFG
jgi:type II secretory pathway pseudopilin PulG